eukprot:CAMPEP_0117512906 /NCGR_PEP_ID=MMETSP0784-20121206/29275_1 /TAXON_ID=39447 /ORGANISM="" /LENGTH=420 /DNA_ID=CAMNT_0005308645 /DNA_START=59 /DNA_END=1321 /DNA_ORIENTATION=-
MAIEELVDNPDGCARFDPNPFKKEKCKNCGRLWTEHKGVIAQELVEGYVKAKQKLVEDRQKAEAEAKAKAQAKKQAKKASEQAVEDTWLMEGDGRAAEVDSDDDCGFKMYSQEELDRQLREQMASAPQRPLKVLNLIDFGECDVPENSSKPAPAAVLIPNNASTLEPIDASRERSAVLNTTVLARGSNSTDSEESQKLRAENQKLQDEIEYLRQMLANANEEKNIQVAIVQDEVVEKQQIIEELTKRRAEMEASWQAQLNSEREVHRQELAVARAQAERLGFEVQRARESSSAESRPPLPKGDFPDGGAVATNGVAAADASNPESKPAQDATAEEAATVNEDLDISAATRAMPEEGRRHIAMALRQLRLSADRHLAQIRRQMLRPDDARVEPVGQISDVVAAVAQEGAETFSVGGEGASL